MIHVAFQGIRGGVGTTSTVAAVGYALQKLGEAVLIIELSPQNLLGLHFGLDAADTDGWARALINDQAWRSSLLEVMPGLHLLPFGSLRAEEHLAALRSPHSLWSPWPDRLATLSSRYSIVLLDIAAAGASVLPQTVACDLRIITIEADAACQALLSRQAPQRSTCHLITRFESSRPLQRDIRRRWQQQLGSALIPHVLHHDESVAHALVNKSPVGLYARHSVAAQDACDVAAWCLARARHAR